MARRAKTTATQEPQPAKDVNAAVRHLTAIELRIQGHTWEQIAIRCGYKGGKATAYNVVNAALKALRREKAEELRALEAERLDAMLRAIWPEAVHESEKPRDESEKPRDEDDEETKKAKRRGANLWAIDRVLGIMERRARLFGLDVKGEGASVPTIVRESYPTAWTDALSAPVADTRPVEGGDA